MLAIDIGVADAEQRAVSLTSLILPTDQSNLWSACIVGTGNQVFPSIALQNLRLVRLLR